MPKTLHLARYNRMRKHVPYNKNYLIKTYGKKFLGPRARAALKIGRFVYRNRSKFKSVAKTAVQAVRNVQASKIHRSVLLDPGLHPCDALRVESDLLADIARGSNDKTRTGDKIFVSGMRVEYCIRLVGSNIQLESPHTVRLLLVKDKMDYDHVARPASENFFMGDAREPTESAKAAMPFNTNTIAPCAKVHHAINARRYTKVWERKLWLKKQFNEDKPALTGNWWIPMGQKCEYTYQDARTVLKPNYKFIWYYERADSVVTGNTVSCSLKAAVYFKNV